MTTEATAGAATTRAAQDALDTRAVQLSLTAKDVQQSIAWYRDVLGFTVEYPMERDGKVFAAAMRSGAARIILNQDDGGRGWERVKGEGFAITFDTAQDVETRSRPASRRVANAHRRADRHALGRPHVSGARPGWLSTLDLETPEHLTEHVAERVAAHVTPTEAEPNDVVR